MQRVSKAVVSGVLIVYLLGLVWLLFFYQDQNYSRLSNEALRTPNFEPFKSIRHYLFVIVETNHGFSVKSGAAVNLFGNMLLFVPAGFLIPLVIGAPNTVKFAFMATFCICIVELFQWKFQVGIFDIDDIFLNVIGCLTGFLFIKSDRTLALKKSKAILEKNQDNQ